MGYYDNYIESDDFLEHHGIMGQKWGIRRYQNPDGTLTPEGRKHYNMANDRVNRKINDKERSGRMYDKAIERRSKDPDRMKRKQQDKERSQKMYNKAIEKREYLRDNVSTYPISKIISTPSIVISLDTKSKKLSEIR